MNVLAISGSLQSQSSNSALVHYAAAHCGNGLEVHVFDQLAELPHFNPDFDGEDPPAAVRALRAMAGAANAILIASPEYAHEMPGSLKNALDWLVSSGELYGKPTALLCGSPSQERGAFAREAIQHTLEAEGARVVMSTTVAMQRSTSGAPDIDPAAGQVVVAALETLRRACEGS